MNTSHRTQLLARLLTIGTTLTAACGGKETQSTGVQQGPAGGGAGEGGAAAGGSSGSSGQSGQGGASAAGQGGTAGVSGQGGASPGGAAGAGGTGTAAGAGGSEALPACELPSPCTAPKGVCYDRGDEETCAPADSAEAWTRLGCELLPSQHAHPVLNGAECCYQEFCGEGRPLYVDGQLTRAPSRRRGDWG